MKISKANKITLVRWIYEPGANGFATTRITNARKAHESEVITTQEVLTVAGYMALMEKGRDSSKYKPTGGGGSGMEQ